MTDSPTPPTPPEALAACPFCGGTPKAYGPMSHTYNYNGTLLARVACQCCGTRGANHATQEEAIAAWNRRTPPPPAPTVEELTKRAEHAELWAASARDELTRLGVPMMHMVDDCEVVMTGAERVRALANRAPTVEEVVGAVHPLRARLAQPPADEAHGYVKAEQYAALRSAVEWVLTDASYKAPESIDYDVAERWLACLRDAIPAARREET